MYSSGVCETQKESVHVYINIDDFVFLSRIRIPSTCVHSTNRPKFAGNTSTHYLGLTNTLPFREVPVEKKGNTGNHWTNDPLSRTTEVLTVRGMKKIGCGRSVSIYCCVMFWFWSCFKSTIRVRISVGGTLSWESSSKLMLTRLRFNMYWNFKQNIDVCSWDITRLTYTGLPGGGGHLKIETRLRPGREVWECEVWVCDPEGIILVTSIFRLIP